MKALALLSLSLAVALAVPPFPPGVVQNPGLTKEDQSPLLGDWVPLQGHVEVENPAPQPVLASEERQEKEPSQSQKQKDEVKPLVKVEQEDEVKTEVKVEPEVKVGQEVKAVSEVKVEQGGEVKTEVEMEPELKAEPEVKVEQIFKEQQEPEAVSEVQVEQEPNTEPEVEPEPQLNMGPEPEEDLNSDVMSELQVNVKPDAEMELEVKADPDFAAESEVQVEVEPEPQLNVGPEPEEDLNSDVMSELQVNVKPDAEMEPEVKADPDFAAESEVQVEPDVRMEPEPKENTMYKEVQEEFQVQMRLEAETETGPEDEERHIDMERKYEMVGEPIMELEPVDDNNMLGEEGRDAELPEVEKSSRPAFQSRDPVAAPLPEEEGLPREEDNVLSEEPIMELEPEMRKEPFQNPDAQMLDAAIMEEGPALDIMGKQIHSENYFPNEEVRMWTETESLKKEMSGYLVVEEPKNELVRGAKQGQRSWPCVAFQGKCYQFFGQPKAAADAEFFCQTNFIGGHLASITSRFIHNEMMNMMLNQNGAYTRSWIGGLRYLQTGRFIWLDGSHWGYADWLYGEPNNTANKEDCVEVLANGKFNDFTCWEPQPFFCSYSLP